MALYARVSAVEQVSGLSIDKQIEDMKHYSERKGWTVIGEYVDAGLSGSNDDRPQFQKMMVEAFSSKFDRILVAWQDRFARNSAEEAWHREKLEPIGVFVYSVREEYDPQTPSGKMQIGIQSNVSQFWSTVTAQKIKDSLRYGAEQGYWMASHAPYGYRIETVDVMDGQKRLQSRRKLVFGDPEAVETVKKIYDWYVNQGIGLKGIATRLNDLKMPSPGGKGPWRDSAVRVILHNEHYTGTMIQGRWIGALQRKKMPPGVKYRPEPQQYRKEHSHPAIIPIELFDQVKERAQSRTRGNGLPATPQRALYLLSGKLICDACGEHCTHHGCGAG